MAIPILGAAAMAAARVVASKLATRAVGGITGTGARSVGSVYRNSPVSRRMGDPRGVKTNQSGSLKVKPPTGSKNVANFNATKTSQVKDFKSGAQAKRTGNSIEADNIQGIISGKTGDPKIIKINSRNTRAR